MLLVESGALLRAFWEMGLFRAVTAGAKSVYGVREHVHWKTLKNVGKLCTHRHYNIIIFHSKVRLAKHVKNCGPFWKFWGLGGCETLATDLGDTKHWLGACVDPVIQ